MKITVTQDHIDNGVCGNPFRCAIAQAVSELYPDYQVRVSDFSIFVSKSGPNLMSRTVAYSIDRELPEEMREFIANFDDGKQVTPTIFEVDIYDYDKQDVI